VDQSEATQLLCYALLH